MTTKSAITLTTPIRYIKGVGPKMSEKLAKINIKTIQGLIYHFPFRHEDYSLISPIAKIQEGEIVTLIGKINKVENIYTRSLRQKTIQRATLSDKTGSIRVIWFNQPYLIKTLSLPTIVSISGKVRRRGGQLQLVAPRFEILGQDKRVSNYQIGEEITTNTARLVPIYPVTFGVTNKYLRSLLARTLPTVKEAIKEFLPDEIINQEKLIGEKEAVIKIHFPESKAILEKAKKRLAFDELFFLQLRYLKEKHKWQKNRPAAIIKPKLKPLKKFIRSLLFKLTKAQEKTINEIINDFERPIAMNRLLQGDVGSGKTVVAAAAALIIAKNNYQTVFMVPTEILAQQHYENLKRLFEPLDIKVALITSSTSKNTNQTPTKHQLIIGTHALIHKYAQFEKVGLVIIDEQHRFGVSQRAKLVKKANLADKDKLFPHILTMTATPIPRTITLTVYGDLDVSTLDEMPPGRKPVETHFIPLSKRKACYQWIREQVEKNKIQVFVVCPLIEESETLESVKAATTEYERLKNEIFPDLNLALLHGRMRSKQKEAVLLKVKKRKVDILIATPVVEVGIDIPNINIIIIEAANRFGLSQLHQLRGRAGRGKKQAYCFLFAEKTTKRANIRLKAMEGTNDGMKLAKIDLQIRGPGEIYSTKQHGFPEFKIASYNDLELIRKAHQWAQEIINTSPNLTKYPELQKYLQFLKDPKLIAPN